MITSIIILVVVGAGLLTSFIFPVHLPEPMRDAIGEFFMNLTPFDGIVPIFTFIKAIGWIIFIRIMFLVFKLVMGIFALATGGGKPEIE